MAHNTAKQNLQSPSKKSAATQNAWATRNLHHNRALLYLDDLPTVPAQEPNRLEEILIFVGDHIHALSDRWLQFHFFETRMMTFYIVPGSSLRKLLNLLLAVAIIIESAVIPFRSVWGFDWPLLPFWLALDYFMDAIYIFDIFLHFVTAFTQDGTGKMITNRRAIAVRYIKTEFLVHLLSSLPLDVFALKYGIDSLPWFRLNRMIRVLNLSSIFSALEKGFDSPIIRMLRLFFLMMLFAHWFGCTWFFIAKVEGLGENTWAHAAGLNGEDAFTQYLTSAYWALVVMTTVGFGDIVPVSNIERAFTIVTMITGVSIYATIFGNMATLIAQMDASATRYREKLDSLHEYMRYRGLPQYLRSRILNYYDVIWSRHKGIDENLILNELPSSLRSEIALYLNRELVENVPLFKGSNEPGFINSLVVMLKPQVALEGDYIIRHGEIGREMYFLSRGEVEVVSGDGKTVFARLKEGSYFGEIALLFAARRIASIRASGYCELLLLTKEDFDSVLNFFPSFADSMRVIAKQKIEEERRKRELEAQNSQQATQQNQPQASETKKPPAEEVQKRPSSAHSGGSGADQNSSLRSVGRLSSRRVQTNDNTSSKDLQRKKSIHDTGPQQPVKATSSAQPEATTTLPSDSQSPQKLRRDPSMSKPTKLGVSSPNLRASQEIRKSRSRLGAENQAMNKSKSSTNVNQQPKKEYESPKSPPPKFLVNDTQSSADDSGDYDKVCVQEASVTHTNGSLRKPSLNIPAQPALRREQTLVEPLSITANSHDDDSSPRISRSNAKLPIDESPSPIGNAHNIHHNESSPPILQPVAPSQDTAVASQTSIMTITNSNNIGQHETKTGDSGVKPSPSMQATSARCSLDEMYVESHEDGDPGWHSSSSEGPKWQPRAAFSSMTGLKAYLEPDAASKINASNPQVHQPIHEREGTQPKPAIEPDAPIPNSSAILSSAKEPVQSSTLGPATLPSTDTPISPSSSEASSIKLLLSDL